MKKMNTKTRMFKLQQLRQRYRRAKKIEKKLGRHDQSRSYFSRGDL